MSCYCTQAGRAGERLHLKRSRPALHWSTSTITLDTHTKSAVDMFGEVVCICSVCSVCVVCLKVQCV